MIPILYSSTTTDFSTNGYGRLADCTSCVVTEERNGDYTLELTYPTNGKCFEHIAVDSIIGAKPNNEVDVEHFRVVSVNATSISSVTVTARQIALETMKNNVIILNGVAMGGINIGDMAQQFWNLYSAQSPYVIHTGDRAVFPQITFTSDIYDSSETMPLINLIAQWNNALIGAENSLIDRFGGEISYHDMTVSILSARGSDKGVKLAYGKNIIGIQQMADFSNTYDGVIPVITTTDQYDTTVVVAHGTNPAKNDIIWNPYRDLYSSNRILALDVTSLISEDNNVIDYNATWNAAKNYVDRHPEMGLPDITTTVQFVPLGQTEEYKHLAEFESLSLCDTVLVYFPALGVNKQAKVVKTVYNTLREKYDSLEIGTLRQTLAQTIANIKRGR